MGSGIRILNFIFLSEINFKENQTMDVVSDSGWKSVLSEEFKKDYYKNLQSFVQQEYKNNKIYPPRSLVFNAFLQCSYKDLKVVIIGQDPYHSEGQANGLCFSVNDGVRIPPSLRNIFKELKNDTGKEIYKSGNLTSWASQGVLMLNAILTVRDGQAGSHSKKGWEIYTDAVIREINKQKDHIVFILWGNYAIQKGKIIDRNKHLVLTSVHPSPLSASRGFFGNNHFSRTNKYLIQFGVNPIIW